jgi:REP element-mobilizing transposase RayT
MAGLTEMTGKKVVDKIDGVYYSEMVKRIIGYMVTWTTYGTWLQGEKKGYVKNGKILAQNDKLKSANQRQQKYPTVKLNSEQKQIVQNSIIEEAQRINHKIFAIAACSNHVHIVAGVSEESIEQAVHRCKYSATSALRKFGSQGKIWSKGFDKRFCFADKELENKVRYVRSHNNG